MDSSARSARNELFQELKPKCIELSQLALQDDGSTAKSNALIESTSRLLALLKGKCQRTDGVFDTKLADYVFFPLSQILRRKQKFTGRLAELNIKCLRILLEYGWREGIPLDLANQLLILLTFVAGGVPGKELTRAPEELLVEAYSAIAALFRDLANTPGAATKLVSQETLPALGHCVTVILDGMVEGPSSAVQLQALFALEQVWRSIKDQEALSSFLPGTISVLAKCLIPTTGSRRSRKFIVKALGVLSYVLTSILSDIHTRNIRTSKNSPNDSLLSDQEKKGLTASWLKATTGQIKLALSNIMKLRSHESVEVRIALNKMCITILDECHDTMAESSSMLVETCMTLNGIDSEDDLSERTTNLVDLASIHGDLGDVIKNTVYNWVTSIPTVMQANDENAKVTALSRLTKTLELLKSLNMESSMLEDTLGNSLRDSITVTLGSDKSLSKGLEEAQFDLNSEAAVILTKNNALPAQFAPIVMSKESQKYTRTQLTAVLENLGSRETQIRIASEMLQYARNTSGPGVLSSYWLSFQILKCSASTNQDLDQLFESSLTLSNEQAVAEQELFSYSLSLLTDADDSNLDWRLQGIALEAIAVTAQRAKEEFRIELVDTLYPISQFLGSSNSRLREHAIICLNTVALACGYENASEMIVDNVDYMVNAISLRLNTFDISPQAPQVLVMMIRLAGPSLLLYLDDVVASIFAALDNFHGYQRLVDALFTVLGEVVSVGSKSEQLQIDNGGTSISHRKARHPASTISDISSLLSPKSKTFEESLLREAVPQTPWKSAKTLLDEAETQLLSDQEDDPAPPAEIAKPPPTKTYTMLQSISRLSQHYLTSASPFLRSKLLALISTSSIALYNDEDQFLPLVNDIWPVVIRRLYDDEPFVRIAACDAVAGLCRGAGDFLATRISAEWVDLISFAKQAKGKAAAEKKGKGGRGVYSQNSQVWEAVVKLLTTIVGYVRVEDDAFDEVLELLGGIAWEREETKEALEAINADAVWLAMLLSGKAETFKSPTMDGSTFTALGAES